MGFRRGLFRSELRGNAAETVSALKGMRNRDRVEFVRTLQRSLPGVKIRAENLKRSDLRVLQEGGIAIGNHSMTHPKLDRCSDTEIRDDQETSPHRKRVVAGKRVSVSVRL